VVALLCPSPTVAAAPPTVYARTSKRADQMNGGRVIGDQFSKLMHCPIDGITGRPTVSAIQAYQRRGNIISLFMFIIGDTVAPRVER